MPANNNLAVARTLVADAGEWLSISENPTRVKRCHASGTLGKEEAEDDMSEEPEEEEGSNGL